MADTNLDLDAALARAREAKEKAGAATEGPWRSGRPDMLSYDADGVPYKNVYCNKVDGYHHVTGDPLPYAVARGEGNEAITNAVFIAHARTALPTLASDVEALAGEVHRLQHDLTGRVLDEAERDALVARAEKAEADARILAHAYETDSRPPPDVVKRSLAYRAGRPEGGDHAD